MRKRIFILSFMIVFLLVSCMAANVFGQDDNIINLKMALIRVENTRQIEKLKRLGFDIVNVRRALTPTQKEPTGSETKIYQVEAVISDNDARMLQGMGFTWTSPPALKGQRLGGSTSAYHSYDEPGLGIKAQLKAIEKKFPKIADLQTIGFTIQGRPILAMGLTRSPHDSQKCPHPKPEVLILSTLHAREWVGTQMSMRLIKYLTDNYGSNERVTRLLNTTKIWIIPVANPDGYEFTFSTARLWRKNLHDNDGNGIINKWDGVDLNRNFDFKWDYNNEGSSPDMFSSGYRGTAPESEPEIAALTGFISKHNLKFTISYHSYGDLLSYLWEWQLTTPSHDEPLFRAQAGTEDKPAIHDSLVDKGYATGVYQISSNNNGDMEDWCYGKAKIPAYLVELTYGQDKDGNFYGFEFPDDENQLHTVFKDNLEFALCLAESAVDPSHPVSPVGVHLPSVSHKPITASYGSNQVIDILAKKNAPTPQLYFSINGGSEQRGFFKPHHGLYYNTEPGIYFDKYRAIIKGQKTGDSIVYRIVKGSEQTGPYAYKVINASGNPILIVSAEDYTGQSPPYDPPTAPHYLKYYTDALDSAGYKYDIWDVTAQNAVPNYNEVLSNYHAIIWYTGDDDYPEVPYEGVLENEILNFREAINERCKLLVSGQDLSFSLINEISAYPPDFFKYYLNAYIQLENTGIDPDNNNLPYAVKGMDHDPIFKGLAFNLYGGDGANNQFYNDSFFRTSPFLPHFKDHLAASYIRPGAPFFEPHSGAYYVYNQQADSAYKRLGGVFKLPEGNPKLSFWTSYNLRNNRHFLFVEVAEQGTDHWTTLPDLNGLSTTSVGKSCRPGGIRRIHPFLAHYMDDDCNPPGTSGFWNAFTGNSGGWKKVEMDLSAYAGQTVELYISYASNWEYTPEYLGVFVDDIEISGQPLQDFEQGMGHWSADTAPGSEAYNNWMRCNGFETPDGPAIRTDYSLYLGFGFEAIDTAAHRTQLMRRIMKYFGL